jgi:uncharacterized membrane protein
MSSDPQSLTTRGEKRVAQGKAARTRRWWRPERWEDVPHIRSGDELTVGEQAADVMRNGMGSWGFVFGALIFLAVWMGYNRNQGFDAYPFILLNLVLSCLAAMQGAILLIAAKRADAISAELAKHDYEADCSSRDMLETLTSMNARIEQLTTEVHRHVLGDSSAPVS